MSAEVECYAGSSYPETPRALLWEGQRYTVQAVLERRREVHGLGFLVRCLPGDVLFDVFYHTETDQWHIKPQGPAVNHQPPIQPNA